ncbi:MAG: outer membrane protein [Pseudorhodoplanes sp.]
MKKLLAAAAALATVMISGHAQAADIGYRQYAPAPPPVPVYRWTGPYFGANVGYIWGNVDNSPANPSGIAGGIQAGYNWQNGIFVFGFEGDLNLSNSDDTFAPWQFSNPWFGTVRGRVGVAAWNNLLFYATGGIAFGGLQAQLNALEEDRSHLGWTIGAGAEYALTQNWSVKAEYLYMGFSSRSYTVTGADHGFDNNLLRFGFNYRF